MVVQRGTVKVYHFPLNAISSWISKLRNCLAIDEIERANRFLFKADQDQFIFCRGVLRLILSNYLSCAPAMVCFEYGTKGKPRLSALHHNMRIEFNLSHTKDYALIAITGSRQLGIDIEYNRSIANLESLLTTTLAKNEINFIKFLPISLQRKAFLHYWTQKEAFTKSLGAGLENSMSEYDLGDWKQLEKKILNNQWTILDISPNIAGTEGYIAALAYQGTNLSIEHLYANPKFIL